VRSGESLLHPRRAAIYETPSRGRRADAAAVLEATEAAGAVHETGAAERAGRRLGEQLVDAPPGQVNAIAKSALGTR
jgi:hypothetical protein